MTHDITKVIDIHFGKSEPGAELHHLVLSHQTGRTPLGLPKLRHTVVVIAPAGPDIERPDQFIARAVTAAIVKERADGPLWSAVFTLEISYVALDQPDEVAENRVRRMHADHQLRQHPDAVEATQLYAACADGRRWYGTHALTGPIAGNIDGPHLLQGPPQPGDRTAPLGRLIRGAVGISW